MRTPIGSMWGEHWSDIGPILACRVLATASTLPSICQYWANTRVQCWAVGNTLSADIGPINEHWQPAPPSYPGGPPLEYRSRPGYAPSPVHRPVWPGSRPLCRPVQHRHSTTSPGARVESRGVIEIANLGTRANLFPNRPDYREGPRGSHLTSGHHQPSPSLHRRDS